MPHKLRKTRKMRGSRTHGYGQVGQHRKSGSRGGVGKAGRDKHGWTYVVKYEPDYFGKKGFKSIKQLKKLSERTINVGDLDELSVKLSSEGKLTRKDGKLLLNLEELGYTKLLGRGDVSEAFLIKVPKSSPTAVEKIKASGGDILEN